LFGATEVIAGAGVSKAGRPRLPTRLQQAQHKASAFLTIIRSIQWML
jgi:hypothetical protein